MLLEEAFLNICLKYDLYFPVFVTYNSKNFSRYCRHLPYVHSFEKNFLAMSMVVGCQSKHTCVRTLVRYLKKNLFLKEILEGLSRPEM